MLSFCLATIPSNSSEAIRQPSPGSHAHIQALRTALHFWLGTSFNSHTDTNQNRCSVRASADSNHIPCVVLLNMFGNSKLEHPWGPGCSEKKDWLQSAFPNLISTHKTCQLKTRALARCRTRIEELRPRNRPWCPQLSAGAAPPQTNVFLDWD